MTSTTRMSTRSSSRRRGQEDIERVADAVVRTPALEPTLVSFLIDRIAQHWAIEADDVDRRLAVSIARGVSVRYTRRLLRSA